MRDLEAAGHADLVDDRVGDDSKLAERCGSGAAPALVSACLSGLVGGRAEGLHVIMSSSNSVRPGLTGAGAPLLPSPGLSVSACAPSSALCSWPPAGVVAWSAVADTSVVPSEPK